MIFLETSVFTKMVTDLLTDEEYRQLQCYLITRPNAGEKIQGCGSLSKLRWGLARQGKRGGSRMIYYWAVESDQILMLLIYTKNQQDDLTHKQKKKLQDVIEEEFHG